MLFYGIERTVPPTSEQTRGANIFRNGFQEYYEPKKIFKVLLNVFSSSKSDFQSIIERLETLQKTGNRDMYQDVIERLKTLNENDKRLMNQLLFKMISQKQEMLLPNTTVNTYKDGNGIANTYVSVTVVNENNNNEKSSSLREVKKYFEDVWESNNNGVISITDKNKEELKAIGNSISDLYKQIVESSFSGEKTPTTTLNELKKQMDKLGFSFIESSTYYSLYNNGYFSEDINFFKDLTKSNGVLQRYVNQKNPDGFWTSFTTLASSYINKLISANVEMKGEVLGETYVSGGKTIQITTLPNMYDDQIRKLTDDEHIQRVLRDQYSSNSILSGVLKKLSQGTPEEVEEAKRIVEEVQKLYYHSLGMNKKGDKVGDKYDQSSRGDHLKNTLLFYMDKNFIQINNSKLGSKLPLRMALVPSLTISDKGRTVLQNNVVLDLSKEGINVFNDDKGIYHTSVSDKILNSLVNMLFIPELNVITEKYKSGKENAFNTYFYHLPLFNTIKVRVNGTDMNILKLLKYRKGELSSEELSYIKNEAKTIISNYINNLRDTLIKARLDEKKGTIINGGYFYDDKILSQHGGNLSLDTNALNKYNGSKTVEKAMV